MRDWKDLPTVREIAEYTYLMWQRGWDEANGGNISVFLTDEEAAQLDYAPGSGRTMPLPTVPDALRGRFVCVTATGSFFREVRNDLDHLLGICYIPLEGDRYEIARGLEGSRPTSEFDSHLATHAVRLAADAAQRVVMHNHATHILAMTHAGPQDERAFTLELWRVITEALILFPDGIGYVPWCVCGGPDIAAKTLEKMTDRRIVIWEYHGVFTTGSSMHDAFGLLETVDKCCEAWLLAHACGHVNPGISDEELRRLARDFNVTPRAGYLD